MFLYRKDLHIRQKLQKVRQAISMKSLLLLSFLFRLYRKVRPEHVRLQPVHGILQKAYIQHILLLFQPELQATSRKELPVRRLQLQLQHLQCFLYRLLQTVLCKVRQNLKLLRFRRHLYGKLI